MQTNIYRNKIKHLSYPFHFHRYTSEYQNNVNQNNGIDSTNSSTPTSSQHHSETSDDGSSTSSSANTLPTLLSARFSHDLSDNQIGNNFNVSDYAPPQKFDDIILTTPETTLFDMIHSEFEKDKNHFRHDDGDNESNDLLHRQNATSTKYDDPITSHLDPQIVLNSITKNSTDERNSSVYYNNAEVENVNYDLTANEIHNRTIGNTTIEPPPSGKRGKFLQQQDSQAVGNSSSGSDVNLTTSPAKNWSAAVSTKRVEHEKIKDGIYLNVTATKNDVDASSKENSTLVTKQLADWVEVMRHQDFANNSFGSDANATAATPLPSAHLDLDSASQENHIVSVHVSATTAAPALVLNAKQVNDSMTITLSQDLIHKEKMGLDSGLMMDELLDTTTTTVADDTTTTTAPDGDDDVDDDDADVDDEATSSTSDATTDADEDDDVTLSTTDATTDAEQSMDVGGMTTIENIADDEDWSTVATSTIPNMEKITQPNMVKEWIHEKFIDKEEIATTTKAIATALNEDVFLSTNDDDLHKQILLGAGGDFLEEFSSTLPSNSNLDFNAIIAISVSVVGVISLALLLGFLVSFFLLFFFFFEKCIIFSD